MFRNDGDDCGELMEYLVEINCDSDEDEKDSSEDENHEEECLKQSNVKKETKAKSDNHKYYAVAKGRIPGIYNNWGIYNEQVHRFSGAVYKSFNRMKEAETFISDYEKHIIKKGLHVLKKRIIKDSKKKVKKEYSSKPSESMKEIPRTKSVYKNKKKRGNKRISVTTLDTNNRRLHKNDIV